MKQKRELALLLALLLALPLAGCDQGQGAQEASASVQSVAMLMGVSLSGSSQYAGVVEPKATVSVNKDENKTVDECHVAVGDTVQVGDLLFTYDSDALQLTLATAELEVQQLENSIASYTNQIADLERERKKAPSADRLEYTLQIQEAELNRAEAEYNLAQKQAELERMRASMDETEVYAEVSGIVQSISDQDSGGQTYYDGSGSGGSGAYITIMETGTYRIKGTATEETVRSLYQGLEVTAISRLDENETWAGVIESVNTSTTEEDNNNYSYDAGGESSAKYAFYVTLDSSDGLLIGQHVYLRLGGAEAEENGVRLSSGYLVMDESGESASVWVANAEDRLELHPVTLGAYDGEMDEYEIADGLALEDYIAWPDDTLSEGMRVVRYDESSFGGYEDGGVGEDYVDEGYADEGYADEGYVDEGYVDEEYVDEGYADEGYADEGDVGEDYIDEDAVDESDTADGDAAEADAMEG